jgi:hypothetical protein
MPEQMKQNSTVEGNHVTLNTRPSSPVTDLATAIHTTRIFARWCNEGCHVATDLHPQIEALCTTRRHLRIAQISYSGMGERA